MLQTILRHSWTYSCILRHIQTTWLIQAYLEPQTYLVSFRHIIQVLLRSNLCIFWTLFRHVMFHAYAGIFSTLEYVIKQYFVQNKKFSNLEPKMSYLCYFSLSVWKSSALFKISTYDLVKMQKFRARTKSLNLRQEIALFSIFLD